MAGMRQIGSSIGKGMGGGGKMAGAPRIKGNPANLRHGTVPGAGMAMGEKLSKRTAGPGSMAHSAAPKLPGNKGMSMPAPIAPIAAMPAGPRIAPRGIIGGSMKTGLASGGDLTSTGGMPNVG